jgi:hypothetical protein
VNREDFLREIDEAGRQLRSSGRELAAAANPVNQLRAGVAKDWRWWLPGASVAGFAVARLLRRPVGPPSVRSAREGVAGGAAFWVPLLLRLVPGALTQLMPLFLSLRSGRNR